MIVYDITNVDSFKAVGSWMSEVEKYGSPGMCKLLIGNKCDLVNERAVKQQEGATLAKNYGMKFIETSAKDLVNVQESFKMMSREIFNKANRNIMKATKTQDKPTVTRGSQIILTNDSEVKSKSK